MAEWMKRPVEGFKKFIGFEKENSDKSAELAELDDAPVFSFEGDGSSENPYRISLQQLAHIAEKAGWRQRDSVHETSRSSYGIWLGDWMREIETQLKMKSSSSIHFQLEMPAVEDGRGVTPFHEYDRNSYGRTINYLKDRVSSAWITIVPLEFYPEKGAGSFPISVQVMNVATEEKKRVPFATTTQQYAREIVDAANKYYLHKEVAQDAEYIEGHKNFPLSIADIVELGGNLRKLLPTKKTVLYRQEQGFRDDEESLTRWLENLANGDLESSFLKLHVKTRLDGEYFVLAPEGTSNFARLRRNLRAIFSKDSEIEHSHPIPRHLLFLCEANISDAGERGGKRRHITITLSLDPKTEDTEFGRYSSVTADMLVSAIVSKRIKDSSLFKAKRAQLRDYIYRVAEQVGPFLDKQLEPEKEKLAAQGIAIDEVRFNTESLPTEQ